MDTRKQDTLSAVAARRRGRTRLRAATIALGAAGLAGAGAVAYSLPAVTHSATGGNGTGVSAPASSAGSTVHTTSGGSGVTTTTQTAGGSGSVAASSGHAHVVSSGS